MPYKSSREFQRTKAERARQWLSGGGVTRDDSDDELGLEDHPWKWLYSDSQEGKNAEPEVVGARMGSFHCLIGDCVLLKAEGEGEAWIGLICGFQDDEEGDKAANFMWFSTEREIRNKEKKRTDALPNEVYITPSWDLNPLASINGKASIVSSSTFHARYPSGRVPRSSKDYGKVFICRRGCSTRTATYTDEFQWEEVYGGADDLDALIQRVKGQTKATRKRKRDHVPREDWEPTSDAEEPKTPSKRRKTQQASTPTSKPNRTPRKFITPTHRRVIVKKPLEFTPLGTRILSPRHTISSPFQIARTTLHVSSVPTSLPCRTEEFSTVYEHLEAAISAGSGSCIYISGTPGTGKTATVREVVAQLNASVQAEELDDFIFVEINGMKVTDPHQAYSLLWEALRGERVSPAHALGLLERELDHPSPRRVPCVVLMDELDQLVTKNQSVMYNFFNWPGLRHSRLIVLAVANTMDLPERTLSNKISSRLGLTRITFPGYTHDQLTTIIKSRLSSVPSHIVDPDAIQFASRKEAEGIINLATVDDEEHEFLPPRSPRSPSFDFDAFDEDSPAAQSRRKSGISTSRGDRSSGAETISSPHTPNQTSSQPYTEKSTLETPPPKSRPRKESAAKAKSVLENIHHQRSRHETAMLEQSSQKKLPFDTTSLRDLVTRAGVVTRALKEIVRRADNTPVTPQPKSSNPPDPHFTQIYKRPSSPSLNKTPRKTQSPRNGSLIGSTITSNDNDINGHMKIMTVA